MMPIREPLVLVAGTNPGAGTTYVTATLAMLSAGQQPTHIVDMSDRADLERLLRPGYACVRPTYSYAGELPWRPAEAVAAAVEERLQHVPSGTELAFATTSSLHWEARRAVEHLADLRLLVMEASTRGSDATAAWLNASPNMPTLVVINALPNGNAGRHGRMAIGRLHDEATQPVEVLTIRAASVIRGTFHDERPPLERIRKHPMLEDYEAVLERIKQQVSSPTATTV